MSTVGTVVFCILAAVAMLAAWKMIVSHHPVHSALYLVTCFIATAGVYLLLGAPFIAVAQVAVYAGAIMVVFLFVLMYLNLGLARDLRDTRTRRLLAVAAAGVLALLVLAGSAASWAGVVAGTPGETVKHTAEVLESGQAGPARAADPQAEQLARSAAGAETTVEAIGLKLFSEYTLPFQLAGVLLLVAMIGVLVIAAPELQREVAPAASDQEAS